MLAELFPTCKVEKSFIWRHQERQRTLIILVLVTFQDIITQFEETNVFHNNGKLKSAGQDYMSALITKP